VTRRLLGLRYSCSDRCPSCQARENASSGERAFTRTVLMWTTERWSPSTRISTTRSATYHSASAGMKALIGFPHTFGGSRCARLALRLPLPAIFHHTSGLRLDARLLILARYPLPVIFRHTHCTGS